MEFKVDKDAKAAEGETIHMLSGCAACMAFRPGNAVAKGKETQASPNGPVIWHHHDEIHRSPMFTQGKETLNIRVKRVSDGRLFGKPSINSGDAFLTGTAQGLYERPCGCTAENPRKHLVADRGVLFNDVDVRIGVVGLPMHGVVSSLSRGGHPPENLYNDMRILWHAGDLPMQLLRANSYEFTTYVQVPGECFTCALDRAMGTGCWLVAAGTLEARK